MITHLEHFITNLKNTVEPVYIEDIIGRLHEPTSLMKSKIVDLWRAYGKRKSLQEILRKRGEENPLFKFLSSLKYKA